MVNIMTEHPDFSSNTHQIPARRKVYDIFNDSLYGKNDSYSKDYLWPVFCYTVHIRLPNVSKYNIIENAVGRMLAIKHGDVQATADSLCLDSDLVAFIAARLKDHMTDFAVGQKKAGDAGNDNDSDSTDDEFKSLTFFMDAAGASGEMLPFVIPRSYMVSKEIKKIDGNNFTYALDNEGRKVKTLHAIPCYLKNVQPRDNRVATTRKFIEVLDRFVKKYCNKNAFFELFFTDSQVEKLRNNNLQVCVNNDPELAYFRVNIRMELATFGLLVSDFTGGDYFRELSFLVNNSHYSKRSQNSFLSKEIEKIRSEFKIDLAQQYYNKNEGISSSAVSLFCDAETALALLPIDVKNDRQQEQYRIQIDKFFSCGYSALEHALYEVYRINDSDSEMLHYGDNVNKKAVTSILRKYNIRINKDSADDDIRFIAGVSSFRLKSIHENHDMSAVLLLCLLQAANNSAHPIISLLQRHPDFICNVRKLKKARDTVNHGSNDLYVTLDKLKLILKILTNYLAQLIPDFKNNVKNKAGDKANIPLQNYLLSDIPEFADAERFQARYDLDRMLGHSFISKLDQNLISRLMILSQKINHIRNGIHGGANEGINNYQCVSDMYRLVESVFSELLSDKIRGYVRYDDYDLKMQIDDFINEITNKSNVICPIGDEEDNSGNSETDTDQRIPFPFPFPFMLEPNRAIATVNRERVVKVLKGQGASLQASVVAFLFSMKDDSRLLDLSYVFKQYDLDLINFFEQLIEMRGHGINTNMRINFNEFMEIFKKFLFVFKVLLDG